MDNMSKMQKIDDLVGLEEQALVNLPGHGENSSTTACPSVGVNAQDLHSLLCWVAVGLLRADRELGPEREQENEEEWELFGKYVGLLGDALEP